MKSFRNYSRPSEPRKIGNVAIMASILISLCILSLIKARYSPSPLVKSQATLKLPAGSTGLHLKTVEDEIVEDEDEEETINKTGGLVVTNNVKPICSESSRRSDTCEAQGDIRIQASSNTIYIIHPQQYSSSSWKIKPYPRKGDAVALSTVKEWTLKPSAGAPPGCTENYTTPAIVFSLGGFTGNLFHDFTDIIVPLFIAAHRFDRRVHLLVTDNKPWWINRFLPILNHMSDHKIIDADSDGPSTVRCFPRAIVGPSFHKELGVDPSRTPNGYSMLDFKQLLRKSFGLQRSSASTATRPRLLIVSRKRSRSFVNVRGMSAMAASLGFDVRVAEPGWGTELAKFARLVNSADVMVGVHGAGLTNMVFLPEGAVLIQVVPLGGLEGFARRSFGEPAGDMGIKYLEYLVEEDESTLIEQYSRDDPVLKDPSSVHKKGWVALKSVYLDNQNVRPHLGRLRNTLLQAIKLLPQGST